MPGRDPRDFMGNALVTGIVRAVIQWPTYGVDMRATHRVPKDRR